MAEITYQGATVELLVIPTGMGVPVAGRPTKVALSETAGDTALSDHLADTSAAHAASAVSASSATLVGVGTDVQAVLEELDNAVVAVEDRATAIEADGSMKVRRLSYTETAGAGVYTGQVVLAAGAVLHSVAWETSVAWGADTSAMALGYTGALTAYGAAVDVDAIGGDQVFGLDTEDPDDFASGTTFNAVLTTTGAGTTAGRSAVTIEYSVPPAATAATKV